MKLIRHARALGASSSGGAMVALLGFGSLALASPAVGAGLAVTRETPASLPGYNVYRPANLAAARRPLPVIAWANGGCVRYDASWTTLFERWASEGYFVVTITLPPGMTDAAKAPRSTPADQAAAIDWAIKQNGTAGSPYRGRLDTGRIVAAGNSCGGISSLTVASKDPRVKSVFVLSGSSVGPNQTREAAQAITGKVSAPVLFVVGGKEDIATPAVEMDYGLLPGGVAAMVVTRSSGDHRTVSTDPAMLADSADISVNWFKATLYRDAAAIKALANGICSRCDPKTWSAKSKNLAAGK